MTRIEKNKVTGLLMVHKYNKYNKYNSFPVTCYNLYKVYKYCTVTIHQV